MINNIHGLLRAPVGRPAQNLAVAGNYFKWVNPTPGLDIPQAVEAAFDDEKALLTIANGDTKRSIVLDYLRLICTVAPASATRVEVLGVVSTATRYSSGGSTITPNRVNRTLGPGTIATIKFGALVTTVENTGTVDKYIIRSTPRSVIPKVQEEYIYTFHGNNHRDQVHSSTSVVTTVKDLGPVVIPPGGTFVLHQWYPSNAVTPAEFELEGAHWEI